MGNGLLETNSGGAEPWENNTSGISGGASSPSVGSDGDAPAVLISGKDSGLDLPPETAENLVILEDPGSGHRAYIVGSAHVSKQAGIDVERVVSAVQPEILAVELDRERLKAIMAILAGEGPSEPPKTVFKALKTMYTAKMGSLSLFFNLQGSFVSALLGVPYGYDMMTAVKVAEDSGVRVALVDRSSFLTLIRLINQSRSIPSSPPPMEPGDRESRKARFDRVKRQMIQRARDAGCDEPAATFESFTTVLATAFKGKEIPLDDFRRVRACGRRIVESFRHSSIHHSLLPPAAAAAFSTPDSTSASAAAPAVAGDAAPGVKGQESSWCPRRHVRERVPMEAVMKSAIDTDLPPAIVAERDLILAQNIRKCTEIGPTVAVVGAGHLPGIIHRWNDALSPASRCEAVSYLLPPVMRARTLPSSSFPDPSSPVDTTTIPDINHAFSLTDSFKTASEASPLSPNSGAFPTPPKIGPLIVAAGLLGLSFYRPRAAMFIGVGLGSGIAASQLMIASAFAKAGRVVGALEDAGKRLGEEEGVLW